MMNMVTGMSTIFLNITVENSEDNLKVFELLRHVKPSWLLENLEYKRFDSGIVNEMRLYYQRSDITLDDAVMVRVYGDGLGDANPRDTEFLALQIAHAVDCFPTLHASFQSGLVYKYIKGRVPTFKDLLKPAIITDITSKIYRLNHVELESLRLFARNGQPAKYDEKSDLFSRMRLYINQIPTEVEETDRNDRFQSFRQDFTNEKLLQGIGIYQTCVRRSPNAYNVYPWRSPSAQHGPQWWEPWSDVYRLWDDWIQLWLLGPQLFAFVEAIIWSNRMGRQIRAAINWGDPIAVYQGILGSHV